jgi:hypothetical protein
MKTVIVIVSGGLVQDVRAPEGVNVVVRDYDVEGSDSPVLKDEQGEAYIEARWPQ